MEGAIVRPRGAGGKGVGRALEGPLFHGGSCARETVGGHGPIASRAAPNLRGRAGLQPGVRRIILEGFSPCAEKWDAGKFAELAA
jgi:hypothetical protein